MQFRIQASIDRASGFKVKEQYINALSQTPKEMMDVNIKDKWTALSRNYQDRLYIDRALQRMRRGEKLPGATQKAIAQRDPVLATQIKNKPGELNSLIKANKATAEAARGELRDFAPMYHRATAKARQSAYTEGRIWAFPGAGNRIFTDVLNPHNPNEVLMTGREMAQNFNKIFGEERVNKALKVGSDMARVGVSLTAAMDGSWPFIQGPMIIGHDVSRWAMGKPSAKWAKATFEMFKTMVNPKWHADFQIRHGATYARAPYLLRSPSEYVTGYGVIEKWASKVPKIGGSLTKIIQETYGRAGAGFSGAAEASRVLFYEQMERSWIKHGGNLVELQVLANQISGAVSSRYLGVGATRRAAESAALFAPSFTRAWLMNLRDLFRGTMKAREIQRAMAGMFASMFGSYITICAALGQEPKLNPAPTSVGGDGAQFGSVELGGVNVGFPGWGYSLLRTMANVGAAAATNPDSLLKFDMSNPTIRAIFSKSSPVVSLTKELVTGKDYFGNRLETGGDLAVVFAEKAMPIAAQSLLEKEPGSNVWVAVGAELLGVRTYPVQPWEELDRMREDLASQYKNTEGDPCLWDELPSMYKDEIRRNNSEFKQLEDEISDEWALRRGTDDERTQYLVEQEVEQEYFNNIQDIASRFLSGEIDGRDFRRAVNDIRGERSTQRDILWRLTEIGKPDVAADRENYMLNDAPVEDRYLNLYYDYLDRLIKNQGAVVEWDRVNKSIDDWSGAIPSYAKSYIERYKDTWVLDLPPEIQPVFQELVQDKAYIDQTGYWTQPDYNEQRALGIQEPQDFRAKMRKQDGKLDAVLAFWGYTNSIQSAGAAGLLKEKAQNIGRSYAGPAIPTG